MSVTDLRELSVQELENKIVDLKKEQWILDFHLQQARQKTLPFLEKLKKRLHKQTQF